MEIKQLKLITGEELICRVVEEDEGDIVIKDGLNIVCSLSQNGVRYYTFRPFLVYQDHDDNLSILRARSVVAYTNPSKDLIREYAIATRELKDFEEEERSSNNFSGDSGTNVVNLFKGPIH